MATKLFAKNVCFMLFLLISIWSWKFICFLNQQVYLLFLLYNNKRRKEWRLQCSSSRSCSPTAPKAWGPGTSGNPMSRIRNVVATRCTNLGFSIIGLQRDVQLSYEHVKNSSVSNHRALFHLTHHRQSQVNRSLSLADEASVEDSDPSLLNPFERSISKWEEITKNDNVISAMPVNSWYMLICIDDHLI